MNKNIIRIALFALVSILIYSCKDETPFSEGYDINLPAATVSSFSDEVPFVGKQIVLTGSNLNTVSSVTSGANVFKIISQYNDSIRVEVPRIIESGTLTITNKYKRQYVTLQILKPQYYVAKVTEWPKEIQRGKPFDLKGENLDLLKEVKIMGKSLSIVGSASSSKVSYATAGIEMGVTAQIETTPKTGDKQLSPALPVVAPRNTYVPKQTIMLFDLETAPTTGTGWSQGTYTAGVVNDGFFGKAFEVSSPAGNGWNGCYIKLSNNNGGAGFDLSAFTKPYITFLVNTKGKNGYMNPAITIGGKESDKHFTQAGGYGDDYKIKTNGWEWRSYDLAKMGFDAIKSKVDKIDLWFRGGNVGSGEPYLISVDQVMITDGPLNPTLGWDCETAKGTDWKLAATGFVPALTGYNQGANYATITGTSTGWDSKLGKAEWTVKALDPTIYENGIWINFLLNTGSKEGYFQFDFGSGWQHFTKTQGYGDDYKFVPTQNKWVWRSVRVKPGEGDLKSFDASKDFTMDIQLYGGNHAKGTALEVNVDYFIFTTVPLDPTLNPEQ